VSDRRNGGGDIQSEVIVPGDRRFTKRFIAPSSGTVERSQLANVIATTVAEDVNTAYYVQEYCGGNYSIREDYVAYLENRIEFILDRAGIG